MMPTALGNALRAAERRAGERYGLDTVAVWPRLFPVIEGRLATVLIDQRNQLDLSVRLSMIFLLLGVAYLGVAAGQTVHSHGLDHSWWIGAISLASLLLTWVAYKSAVGAAVSYGIGMEVAFDLHRFDFLVAMHLPLPVTRSDEIRRNTDLSEFLKRGRGPEPPASAVSEEPDFRYRHPGAAATRSSDEGSDQ